MNRLPDEAAKRVALAHETLAVFKDWLDPADWAKCQRGEDDPDSFCDSNMAVAEAYETVFGVEPDIEQPLVCARWNAAVRLASALLVDPESDPVDALAYVEADDPHGLALVGGGRRLRAIVAEFLPGPRKA